MDPIVDMTPILVDTCMISVWIYFSFPLGVLGLSERSVYVCVHGRVYVCLCLTTPFKGIISWFIDR